MCGSLPSPDSCWATILLHDKHDAFGHALFDCLNGREAILVIEPDDGCVECLGKGQAARWRRTEAN
jgi:hypothetical protein